MWTWRCCPPWRWPAEVDRTSRLLQGVTGHPAGCLRPPYGQSDPAVAAQLRARGLAELYWDVDPSDYLRPGAVVIARRVLAALHPGAIVIMHDGGGNRSQTVAALPAIIRGIRAAGYQIVPVCAGSPNLAGKKRPAPARAPAAHLRLIWPASTGARHARAGISGVVAGDHASPPARATARPRVGWNAAGAVPHRISRRAGGNRARGCPGNLPRPVRGGDARRPGRRVEQGMGGV